MQPSAHATTRNFDEVSFKEHGVSVLPSSKIISSLCVCTTGFDTARSMFMIASINGTFTVYFHQVLAKRRPGPITQFRALLARKYVLDLLLANSGCPKK